MFGVGYPHLLAELSIPVVSLLRDPLHLTLPTGKANLTGARSCLSWDTDQSRKDYIQVATGLLSHGVHGHIIHPSPTEWGL